MQINNPLQLNDWEINHCLIFIFSLQMALWGAIFANMLGLHLSVLLQLIGFVYLTFVPGILILRILRLHKLGTTPVLLYTVGLSLATLMFTGFFMNTIFPLFGILDPISLVPLICTISFVVIILSIFAFIRDRSFSFPEQLNLEEIFSQPVLILFLLPFGAIAGAYLMNFYGNNIVLMIVLLLIALVPVVLLFTGFIQEKHYPYTIFILAITLLYHNSLISQYIWGWDINVEYYLVNNVIQNAIWDPTIVSNCNGMLSLVMLGPIYSIILSMGLDWVFKIIYPFLFAFVVLGLYVIFRQQTNDKIAFLACFFFISIFTFYTEMLQLARQEIAELFLVLIILSMIENDLNKFQKTVFFLIFSSSLIVSHYGLSYLFTLILLLAFIILKVGNYFSSRKKSVSFFVWLQEKIGTQDEINLQKYSFRSDLFTFTLILWYCLFMVIWYIYIAGSSSFTTFLNTSNHIITSISSEFLNPEAVQGLSIIISTVSTPLYEITKYLHLLTIFFIVIGFMISVLGYRRIQFDVWYLLLSFGALGICVGAVVLPYFASALNTSRVYQISLIFLAPFCVLGGMMIFQVMSKFISTSDTDQRIKKSLQVLSIFFALFLLFNSAWVYEVTKDKPGALLNNTVDFPLVNEREMAGAKWLTDIKDDKPIFADDYRWPFFTRFNSPQKIMHLRGDENNIPDKSYIFLGNFNIITNSVLVSYQEKGNERTKHINPGNFLTNRSKIYNVGNAEVYYR
jgi:uncharacterized membrane protein